MRLYKFLISQACLVQFDQSLIYKSRKDNIKIILLKDLNNHGMLPPIYLKPYPLIGNAPIKNKYYLSIYIKTQPIDTNSNTVSLYVPIFKTGSSEALLKLIVLLGKKPQG